MKKTYIFAVTLFLLLGLKAFATPTEVVTDATGWTSQNSCPPKSEYLAGNVKRVALYRARIACGADATLISQWTCTQIFRGFTLQAHFRCEEPGIQTRVSAVGTSLSGDQVQIAQQNCQTAAEAAAKDAFQVSGFTTEETGTTPDGRAYARVSALYQFEQ